MKPLPLPVRIAAGLVATAVDQARDLPRLVVEFPVTAVSQALQATMRVQQKVTELAIKGDRALGTLRPVEEKPSWATFDDDEAPRRNGASTVTELRPQAPRTSTPIPVAQPPAPKPVAPKPVAPKAAAPKAAAPKAAAPEPAAPKASTPKPAGVTSATAPGPAPTAGQPVTAPDTATPDTGAPTALPGYPALTIPQLRGRLRFLSAADLTALLDWETAHGNRAPYLTMLGNRISTVTET